MPFILGFHGFGTRSQARDRINVYQGSTTYVTADLPPDTQADTALECNGSLVASIPWVDDATGGKFEPSTGAFGMHLRHKTDALPGFVFTQIGVSRNRTSFAGAGEYITIGLDGGGNMTLRIAGTVRQTIVSPLTSLTWIRLHLFVSGDGAGDTVRVLLGGNDAAPIMAYTLIGADATALAAVGRPNETWLTVQQTTTIADLACWDPADADAVAESRMLNLYTAPRVPTGAGGSADWSGTSADIDERPASDADKITASATNAVSTFTVPAVTAPGAIAAKVYARVTRSGTDAGANIRAVRDDGSPDNGPSSPAPGDGDVDTIFQPLTVSQINASEWGVESLT